VTPTPVGTATPTPGVTPIAATNGVAYVPDAGLSPVFHGIWVIHFEDNASNLLPSPPRMALPSGVSYPGPIGPMAASADSTVLLTAMSTVSTGVPFTLAQVAFGYNNGAIIPASVPYNAASPQAQPTPTSAGVPTATPFAPAVVPDITGVGVIGNGAGTVGMLVGPAASGIVGVSSLTQLPPQPGGFVPYMGATPQPATNIHQNIAVPNAVIPSTNTAVLLVRGPSDLLAILITQIASGYQFQIQAVDTTLGNGAAPRRGRGAFAIGLSDTTTGIVVGAPSANAVTYISGLPSSIGYSGSNTVMLNSTPHTMALYPTGSFAVVGTDDGFYVISGTASGALKVQQAYLPGNSTTGANSPAFMGCDGQQHFLKNVSSIGISSDGRYVAALGTTSGVNCLGGANSSVVVVPFVDTANGTPAPSPTPSPGTTSPPSIFVQNNIPSQDINTDYMLVK